MPGGRDIGILAPRVVREAALPARWKTRGRFEELAGLDDEALLGRAFSIDASQLAPAPLHYLGMTGRDPAGYCLFAYPVYLHPRREQLILMAGADFELSEREARRLAAAVQAHFPEWRVERTADAMWFIIMDEDPELETTPLREVLGENIDDYLPRGGDAMQWHKILNELQMVLFNCEVNQEREAAGRPPANSLWFWGGGRLPHVHESRWQRVASNDPVALGMGRQAGIDTHRIPDPTVDAQPPGVDLAAAGTLWVHRRSGDSETGAALPASRQWHALRETLRTGKIDELVLIEPGYGELTITARQARAWWRLW